jgi:hypothetical protein
VLFWVVMVLKIYFKKNLNIPPSIDFHFLFCLVNKRLSLRVTQIIDEIFDTSKVTHQDLGRILAIKNFGIIFESELNLYFVFSFSARKLF